MNAGLLKQGLHADPADPSARRPDVQHWADVWRTALASGEQALFRSLLTLDGSTDVRAGVLNDLSTYYQFSEHECVERALGWESWSIDEWQERDRSSPDGLRDFYDTTRSWSFDLLWYAYLQAEGWALPLSVAVANHLQRQTSGLRLLDFGSGVGVTGQLFARLGYDVTLADVSAALQAFARYRLERRGDVVRYLDLKDESPEQGRYDVITAIDTFAHVPDLEETYAKIHRALAPGGLLYATFDARPPTEENAWHLYDSDVTMRRQLQRVGFEQVASFDGILFCYRRVAAAGLEHHIRVARDAVMMSPFRQQYRHARDRVRKLLPGR